MLVTFPTISGSNRWFVTYDSNRRSTSDQSFLNHYKDMRNPMSGDSDSEGFERLV